MCVRAWLPARACMCVLSLLGGSLARSSLAAWPAGGNFTAATVASLCRRAVVGVPPAAGLQETDDTEDPFFVS